MTDKLRQAAQQKPVAWMVYTLDAARQMNNVDDTSAK